MDKSLRKMVGWESFLFEEGIENIFYVVCARDNGKAVVCAHYMGIVVDLLARSERSGSEQ